MDYLFPVSATSTLYLIGEPGTTTLVSVPAGSVYTVLGWNNNIRGSADIGFYCLPQGYFYRSGLQAGFSQQFGLVRCTGDITVETIGSLPISWYSQGSITYVPYNYGNSLNMSTSSYTESSFNIDGVNYYYSPLKAQVGILLFLVTFTVFVYYCIKVFRNL